MNEHNFGWAIESLKDEVKVQRKGWNGKGMYIYLNKFLGFQPCIVMCTAQGLHQPGWLASQVDMLAEDWVVFDGQAEANLTSSKKCQTQLD